MKAVYENGVLRPRKPLPLKEHEEVEIEVRRLPEPVEDEVHVTIETAAPARTPLGRRLRELRSGILRSGAPALGWEQIEKEVASRRGGWREAR